MDTTPKIPGSGRIAGFSLIEQLVVIAIIVILAGLLVPTISMVRASARQTGCLNNQRQMPLACLTYANDWEGFLPYSCQINQNYTPWNITVSDYFQTGGPTQTKTTATSSKVFMCPSDPRTWTTVLASAPRSYYVVCANAGDGWARMDNDPSGLPSYAVTNFSHASSTILIAENASPSQQNGFQGVSSYCWSYADYGTYAGRNDLTHKSKLVYALADGHAEALAPAVVANGTNNFWRP